MHAQNLTADLTQEIPGFILHQGLTFMTCAHSQMLLLE